MRHNGDVAQEVVPFSFKSPAILNHTLANFTSEFGSNLLGAVAYKYLSYEEKCSDAVTRFLGNSLSSSTGSICNDPKLDPTG